jgi:hypothetical protein
MLIVGLNLLLGFVCGIRLTLFPFVIVMLSALIASAFALHDSGVLATLGQLALSAIFLQVGYVLGIVARAYAGSVSPRLSSKASTPGSLPRKAR